MSIAKLHNNIMLVLLFKIIHTVLYNKFILTILLTVEYYFILYINLKIAFHAKFDINKINKVFLFFEKIKKFFLFDNLNKLISYKKTYWT